MFVAFQTQSQLISSESSVVQLKHKVHFSDKENIIFQ